jgi:pimeloyl-ACP methyl ester carboxylesterase
MAIEPEGAVDYDECGAGPTLVLLPGSCSTGAAWRPVIAGWNGEFRCIRTSLLGYGGTTERRTAEDSSISHEAGAVESIVRRAGGPVHLVGHSFGGLVALAVALRRRVSLASLTVLEAPAIEVLRDQGEDRHYGTFRTMTEAYFTAFREGDSNAIARMIDFYGGPGTFASWPARVRAYAVETTPVNILDWATAYGFPLTSASLGQIELPVLVIRGGASPQAVQQANALLAQAIEGASLATVEGAAHFLIATHAGEVRHLIANHVRRAASRGCGTVPSR